MSLDPSDAGNDSLRICPKCRAAVELGGDEKRPCPKCGATVWFYHHAALTTPPLLAEVRRPLLVSDLAFVSYLVGLGVLLFLAAIAISVKWALLAVTALIGVGFAVVALVCYLHLKKIDPLTSAASENLTYVQSLRDRLLDAIQRYNNLLAVGDERVARTREKLQQILQREQGELAVAREEVARDRASVAATRQQADMMAYKYLEQHQKWATTKLKPDVENYQKRRSEVEAAFDFVQSIGYGTPRDWKKSLLTQLGKDFAEVMRVQAAKEQQRAIQQKFREEEKLRRENEKIIREAEEREAELQARLEQALAQQREGQAIVEAEQLAALEDLRRQLEEAHSNAERAKSMAQQTKAGYVYILSNIGSFGEDIYKVGMTRRLAPEERVHELGDASVPFPFDVHAMISCSDAPGLEHRLHRILARYRVNRINLRKEYFGVSLDQIIAAVERCHGKVEYRAEPEALQYRESLEVSPDDLVASIEQLEELGISFEDSEEAVEA